MCSRYGSSDESALATAGGPLTDAGAAVPVASDASAVSALLTDAGPGTVVARKDAGPRRPINTGGGTGKKPNGEKKDAGAGTITPEAPKRSFTLRVNPANVDARYKIADGPWLGIQGETTIQVPAGEVVVAVKTDHRCCKPASKTISAGESSDTVLVQLPRNPGTLRPVCRVGGAEATIEGKFNELGRPKAFEVDPLSGSKKVKVEFTLPDGKYSKQEVLVEAGEPKDVTCGEFK